MSIDAHLRDGVAVPDVPVDWPDGTRVRLEPVSHEPDPAVAPPRRRRGGWWKGRVTIADDFDVLPPDLAEAFGVPAPATPAPG